LFAWITISQLLQAGAYATAVGEHNLTLLLGGVLIILAFWLLSMLVVAVLRHWLTKLARRIKPERDASPFMVVLNPVKWFIISGGVYLALMYLPLPPVVDNFVNRLYRSAIVLFFTWGIYNLLDSHSLFSAEARQRYRLDQSLVMFFSKLARFIIIALGILVAVREWGYDLNGFLAGLGLGGLAIALATKDALANIVGGVVIIMEKPFSVGEWITTADADGIVDEISFRSTRIRAFSQAIITVPNSTLAITPITNHSRLGRKRITFRLGVKYNTSKQDLIQLIEGIRELLNQHPDVIDEYTHVNLEQFGASSLDIEVTFVTPIGEGHSLRDVRNDIHFKIMDLLERLGISLAFPTQTLHVQGSEKE
jgi:MscS family membrane protein